MANAAQGSSAALGPMSASPGILDELFVMSLSTEQQAQAVPRLGREHSIFTQSYRSCAIINVCTEGGSVVVLSCVPDAYMQTLADSCCVAPKKLA